MNQIDRYLSSLGVTQRKALLDLLSNQVRRGEITRDSISSLEIRTTNEPLTAPDTVSSLTRTNPEVYNEFVSRVLVDLRGLYQEAHISDRVIGQQEAASKDFNDTVGAIIKYIEGQIEARKSQLAAGDFRDVFYEPFTDSTSRALSGVQMENGLLILRPLISEVRSLGIQSIAVTRYPSSGIKISNISDGSISVGAHRGYWAESISSPTPPHIKLSSGDVPYDMEFTGVLAVTEITFETPVLINFMKISPFSIYPIRIPWLRYKRSLGDEWNYLTLRGSRYAITGLENIPIYNIDASMVRVLELPILQENPDILVDSGDQGGIYNILDTLVSRFSLPERQDTEGLHQDPDLDLSPGNLVYSSHTDQEALSKMAESFSVDLRSISTATFPLVASPEELPTSGYNYTYGLFNIEAGHNIYQPRGTYRSPDIDATSRMLVSASIRAAYSTPDITSANFFLEIDGGKRYTLLPEGDIRFREHIPVVSDKKGFPKAYYSNEPGTDEFILGGLSGELRELNRIFPSFYIDDSESYTLYRNGQVVPESAYEFNDNLKMIDIPISGERGILSPLTTYDELMLDYSIDRVYGPAGGIYEDSPLVTSSGDFIMVLDTNFPVNHSKDVNLYITTPRTQWSLVEEGHYTLDEEFVVLSGMNLPQYLDDDTEGVHMFLQFYSFAEDINGPVGRRDSSGLPERVDIIESHSRVVGEKNKGFTILAQKYTGTFRIVDYKIILPHIPVVDFNLYNYDGTWRGDPQTGKPYFPILVELGRPPHNIIAQDMTLYQTGRIPHLLPYSNTLSPPIITTSRQLSPKVPSGSTSNRVLQPKTSIAVEVSQGTRTLQPKSPASFESSGSFEGSGIYQYYLSGNILYFNVRDAELDVKVSYEYITAKANLVVEMNSNRREPSLATPSVEECTLKLGYV